MPKIFFTYETQLLSYNLDAVILSSKNKSFPIPTLD